ncbi:urease accessory protein UreD [Neobacillus jeddahensis]|uniref:urease accessory protein UreD n=1 Tax=Neobacillus jeddahensis TaxID=1461580 RepID=UPI00059015E5|nr:urease accessory protein UreD [Neobacillus jeddahensis]
MGELTGFLQLTGARKGRKTILKESYSEGAFKLTRPLYLTQTGEAYFYIMNPGGGYVDGDSYRMKIFLEDAAVAVLTTQSSTKIYKTKSKPAYQEMDIYLKSGSVLEYLPDPVIAYQDACFKQNMVVRMEPDSSFLCSDIITPGWAPDGSWFQYDLVQSKVKIYMGERIVLFDHVKLEPDVDTTGIGIMEGFTHFGTILVIDSRIDSAFVEGLQERLELMSAVRIGLSILAVPGFALRVLANSTQAIEAILSLCHEIVRTNLFKIEPVFLRKY